MIAERGIARTTGFLSAKLHWRLGGLAGWRVGGLAGPMAWRLRALRSGQPANRPTGQPPPLPTRQPANRSNDGFTLIELLISIALGLAIVAVTYAGLRVAAQSVTVSERMALENRLLVAGVSAAFAAVDTWQDLDRPGLQPLRTEGGASAWKRIDPWVGGYSSNAADWTQLPQPFTPFADSWPRSGTGASFATDWLPHQPRTWYRGDGGLWTGDHNLPTDRSAFGNYALFANAADQVRVGGPLDGGTVAVDEHFLPRQHTGLKYALGWYGWFDYLPANALVDWYDAIPAASATTRLTGTAAANTGRGCKPSEIRDLGATTNQASTAAMGLHGRFSYQGPGRPGRHDPDYLANGAERAATRGALLVSNVVGVSAAGPQRSGETAAAYAARQQRQAALNRSMQSSFLQSFERVGTLSVLISSLEQERDLVALRPRHWPEVAISVRRFMSAGTPVNLCYVRVVDPISGLAQELTFPVPGTTLRGARLNRNLD